MSTILCDHRCAFCDATIRNKIHKVNNHTQKEAIAQLLLEMLQKIKAWTITVTSNNYFSSRCNRFCDESGASFLCTLKVAIYPTYHDQQTCDLNKILIDRDWETITTRREIII